LIGGQTEGVDGADRADFVEDGLGFGVEGHFSVILQTESGVGTAQDAKPFDRRMDHASTLLGGRSKAGAILDRRQNREEETMQEKRRSGTFDRARWIGLVMLFVLVMGCRNLAIHTDFDPTVGFASLQSFAWLEPPEVEGADPFADNTLLRKRLRAAIEIALGARGYRPVEDPEEADFLATYSVIMEEDIRDNGSIGVGGYGGYRRYGFGGVYSSPSIRVYQESTLVIDLLDPQSKDLLWRGWGTGIVGTRDRMRSDERIREGVRRILDRFPPDPSKAG